MFGILLGLVLVDLKIYASPPIKFIHTNLPPEGQRSNAIKQAEQIRYCIVQAEEYFAAARHVTLATKPLLIYYGVMSLALAELLIKQSGDSSLDRARARHNHHGLTLSIMGNPSKCSELKDSAALLRATPHMKEGGNRYGTFELWHRSSREMSFSGEKTVYYPSNVRMQHNEIVAYGEDRRPALVPEKGLSLLDCFRSMPTMVDVLRSSGVSTNLLKGRMALTDYREREINRFTTYINPSPHMLMGKLLQKFRYSPGIIDCVDVNQSAGGIIINVETPYQCGRHHTTAPFGFQVNSSDVFFSSENESLNEFGLMYFSSYILGNYARYYPDFWMKDVDDASALSIVVSEFLLQCEERVPLLILSELSQTLHVISS